MRYKVDNIELIPLQCDELGELSLSKILYWNQDYEVVKYMHARKKFFNLTDIQEYVQDRTNKFRWGIVIDVKSGRESLKTSQIDRFFIGIISLQDIDYIDRVGDIAFIIGEKKYYGKGIATKCGRLVLEHGFNILNLNKITIGCFDINLPMCSVAKNLGMSLEGVLREQVYFNNKYHNINKYGITRSEYNK